MSTGDRMKLKVIDNEEYKIVKSDNYNSIFRKKDGLFYRWGKTKDQDPQYGPIEILDMEVSTVCSNGCSFCYKTNTSEGYNMSWSTFKNIVDKMPKTLTQIAFGIGDIDANKNLMKMFKYCRQKNIVPNVTINGKRMTSSYYDMLKEQCGAVAVSLYDYDVCYDAVKELTDRGMEQTNIHCLLSEETLAKCFKVLEDAKEDKRLEKLNAVVFLWLKPKGDRNRFHQLKYIDELKALVQIAFMSGVSIGFDSCSASNFMKAVRGHKDYKQIEQMIEPCESGCFSIYCNSKGEFFPCSFADGCNEWKNGLIIKNNFLDDVWNNKRMKYFKDKNLGNCRKCILYDLEVE